MSSSGSGYASMNAKFISAWNIRTLTRVLQRYTILTKVHWLSGYWTRCLSLQTHSVLRGLQDWNYCCFEDPPTEFSLPACFLFGVLKKQEHVLLSACQETERARERWQHLFSSAIMSVKCFSFAELQSRRCFSSFSSIWFGLWMHLRNGATGWTVQELHGSCSHAKMACTVYINTSIWVM